MNSPDRKAQLNTYFCALDIEVDFQVGVDIEVALDIEVDLLVFFCHLKTISFT